MQITSNGWPGRNWSSGFRWKIIRFRIGDCGPDWWARAEQVAERIAEFEEAGVDLVLLQFSPQLEEMERFAAAVIGRGSSVAASGTP